MTTTTTTITTTTTNNNNNDNNNKIIIKMHFITPSAKTPSFMFHIDYFSKDG